MDKELYARGTVYTSKGTSEKGLHQSNTRINLTRKDMTNASHSLRNIFIGTCLCCLMSGKHLTHGFTVCKRQAAPGCTWLTVLGGRCSQAAEH